MKGNETEIQNNFCYKMNEFTNFYYKNERNNENKSNKMLQKRDYHFIRWIMY